MSVINSKGQLCVSRRSKNKDMKMYVYPFRKAGYKLTSTVGTGNDNYRVCVKVNGQVKTLAYTKTVETANEIAKALGKMQKLFKKEL